MLNLQLLLVVWWMLLVWVTVVRFFFYTPYTCCMFVFWAGFWGLFVKRVFLSSFCVLKSLEKSWKVAQSLSVSEFWEPDLLLGKNYTPPSKD
jgi:hypothetical protein